MDRVITFRKATQADTDACWEVVDAARNHMIAIGRKQWDELYPSREIITRDILGGNAYLLERKNAPFASEEKQAAPNEPDSTANLQADNSMIVAYAVIVKNGEPQYEHLQGTWLSNGDYLVIHRLAVCPKLENQGLARQLFSYTETLALQQGVRSIKIDTNYDNGGMLHLMQALGYTYCGEIFYPRGQRMAFEKQLTYCL